MRRYPAEFMKWVFGGGKRLDGLVTRRAVERLMFVGLTVQAEQESYRQADL